MDGETRVCVLDGIKGRLSRTKRIGSSRRFRDEFSILSPLGGGAAGSPFGFSSAFGRQRRRIGAASGEAAGGDHFATARFRSAPRGLRGGLRSVVGCPGRHVESVVESGHGRSNALSSLAFSL